MASGWPLNPNGEESQPLLSRPASSIVLNVDMEREPLLPPVDIQKAFKQVRALIREYVAAVLLFLHCLYGVC